MKPSPLLLKAVVVVGLGGFALASPSPAAGARGCSFPVSECPVDVEWVCNYYGCSVAGADCRWINLDGHPEPHGTYAVLCDGGEI
jgi:hypothetical protein